ncbi:MAG TPA: DUF4157 domain-containing protein, partial [Kofleriaceae bacterium]|nr:DUF4157 domain-containing protein [Kofleriaceae bacterium]
NLEREHEPVRPPSRVSGKRSLVEQVYGHGVAVQRQAVTQPGEAQIRAAARRGLATPARPLPYADMIQRAFGRHSIASIQAHTGPDAALSAQAMGAQAFASGDHVVLGASDDLFTVAHEAAHVVQQRGSVQLRGGIGEVGDPYERHADAVAELVVQGKSAEHLLDTMAGSGGAGSPAVQRTIGPDPEPEFRSNLAWAVWFQAMTNTEVASEAIRLGLNRAALECLDKLLKDRGQARIQIPRTFEGAELDNNARPRDDVGTSGRDDRAAPAPLTFSFEREGNDLFGLRSVAELNILMMYYPRDLYASEDDWFRSFLDGPALALLATCKQQGRDPLIDPTWPGTLTSCATNMRRAIREIRKRAGQWTQMYRTSLAPPYLREQLMNESGGETWETTHASKEDKLETIVDQLREVEQRLGHAVLQSGLASQIRSPCHLHIAFRRPTFATQQAREEWAGAIAVLAMHLNTYACLRTFETSSVDNGLVGPYFVELMESLFAALSAISIPRGESGSEPQGCLETTGGASNIGAYKSGATAIRHCYKSDTSEGRFDPEILGFELRAWETLDNLVAHMRQIEQVLLQAGPQLGPSTKLSLGGHGEVSTIEQLAEFDYLSQEFAARLKAEHPKVYQVIIEAVRLHNDPSYLEDSTGEDALDLGIVDELALRMMMPFLDWHTHPSVPEAARQPLADERQQMIRRYEGYYDLAVTEAPPEGQAKAQESLQANPYKLIELQLNLWAQRTQIWKYF